MRRKIIFTLAMVVIVLSMITLISDDTADAKPTYQDGDFKFQIYGSNAEITDYVGYNSGTINVPSRVSNNSGSYTVVSLGYGTFWEFDGIKAINLPSTLVKIDDYAFRGCKKVSNFELPDGLETIGASAFYGCSGIREINIPDTVTLIDYGPFNPNPFYPLSLYTESGQHLDVRYHLEYIVGYTYKFAGDWKLVRQEPVPEYMVSFDTVGGTNIPGAKYVEGAYIQEPDDPVKTGYVFKGWNPTIPNTMPGHNLTFRAVWEPENYTITFDSNGGSAIDPITAPYRQSITSPEDPIKEGFVFKGWEPRLPSSMPASDMTVKAIWMSVDDIVYEISFDSNGGSSVGSIHQKAGTSVTAPADPIRSGYDFAGWDPTLPSKMPVGGLAVKAVWTKVPEYTLTFDTDGGSSIPSITARAGTDISVPSEPTKDGYNFVRWNPELPGTMPAEDLTVIAVWEEIPSHTITFDSNGGSTVASITQKVGTTIVTPEDPVREGYSFLSWNPELPGTMPAEDLTVTAVWEEIPTYTITFDTKGGSSVSSITAHAGDRLNTLTVLPEKEGYNFDGWNPEVPQFMPAYDMVIEAVWEKIPTRTITFDSNGGSEVLPIMQVVGTLVDLPDDPVREGFVFCAWEPAVPSRMPDYDMTVTAVWEKAELPQFRILFDTDGGSEIKSMLLAVGTEIPEPRIPQKEGFGFRGWDPALPDVMPSHDITVTAKWVKQMFPIHYDSNGGTPIGMVKVFYDDVIVLPTEPVRDGYTFQKWDPSLPDRMPGKDLHVRAVWAANPEHTITFDTDGGTSVPSITVRAGCSISVPSDPVREGFSFVRWSPAIPDRMPFEDLTVKAVWSENEKPVYTLTFDTRGGSFIEPLELHAGDSIRKPSDPVREGYDFKGWSPAILDSMPEYDITVYAVWEEVQMFTITFDTDGGSYIAPLKLKVGEPVVLPEEPVKEGLYFNGWDPEVPEIMPSYDVTLTAIWGELEEMPVIKTIDPLILLIVGIILVAIVTAVVLRRR